MAKAKAITKSVLKTDGVTLTLTQDEAESLFILLGNVAGSLDGRRRDTEAIYEALLDAGMPDDVFTDTHFLKDANGRVALIFKDERLPLK